VPDAEGNTLTESALSALDTYHMPAKLWLVQSKLYAATAFFNCAIAAETERIERNFNVRG
jgi:hypothetical protein